MEDLIKEAARRSARYLEDLKERSVAPPPEAVARLSGFDVSLQEEPIAPMKVLAELDTFGSAATVASAGPRYFGFVTGGTLPAALAANVLAGAWDQNAVFHVASPPTAFIEEVCRRWLVALFGFRRLRASVSSTGATMANFSALAAARHALLDRLGWRRRGARPVRGAADNGDCRRGSARERAEGVEPSGVRPGARSPRPGRRPGADAREGHPSPTGPRSSASRPATSTAGRSTGRRNLPHCPGRIAWVHVDGAFGLWAAAAPTGVTWRPASRSELVGDRRPQMAQRALRQRDRLLP